MIATTSVPAILAFSGLAISLMLVTVYLVIMFLVICGILYPALFFLKKLSKLIFMRHD